MDGRAKLQRQEAISRAGAAARRSCAVPPVRGLLGQTRAPASRHGPPEPHALPLRQGCSHAAPLGDLQLELDPIFGRRRRPQVPSLSFLPSLSRLTTSLSP